MPASAVCVFRHEVPSHKYFSAYNPRHVTSKWNWPVWYSKLYLTVLDIECICYMGDCHKTFRCSNFNVKRARNSRGRQAINFFIHFANLQEDALILKRKITNFCINIAWLRNNKCIDNTLKNQVFVWLQLKLIFRIFVIIKSIRNKPAVSFIDSCDSKNLRKTRNIYSISGQDYVYTRGSTVNFRWENRHNTKVILMIPAHRWSHRTSLLLQLRYHTL